MKKNAIILLIIVLAQLTYSQSSYYKKDTMMFDGVKVIYEGAVENSKQCKVVVNDKEFTYFPNEVSEYGLNDGTVYLSRVIKIQDEERRVFLERLIKGKVNFYYYEDKYRSKYFIEKDSSQLVELKKGSDNSGFKNTLLQYFGDCSYASDAIKLVTFNKEHLAKLTDYYNSCSHKPFPFVKYGIVGSIGEYKLQNTYVSSFILKSAVFKKDISYTVGAFVDIPISLSQFSFHPEIYYLKNTFYGHFDNSKNIYDIFINSNSAVMPVLLRYTYPSLKFRPFINVGFTFSYCFDDKSGLYSTKFYDNTIEINKESNIEVYPKTLFGLTLGGGLQIQIKDRNSLFMELRYNNMNPAKEMYGNENFQYIIGLNL